MAPVFEAPTPETAYGGGPDLLTEAAAVHQALFELTRSGRPGCLPPASKYERREALLRAAAVTDRWALENGTEAAADRAVRAAQDFFSHDWDDDEQCAGPIGVHAPEWVAIGGTRAYTRQEYLAWYAGVACRTRTDPQEG